MRLPGEVFRFMWSFKFAITSRASFRFLLGTDPNHTHRLSSREDTCPRMKRINFSLAQGEIYAQAAIIEQIEQRKCSQQRLGGRHLLQDQGIAQQPDSRQRQGEGAKDDCARGIEVSYGHKDEDGAGQKNGAYNDR